MATDFRESRRQGANVLTRALLRMRKMRIRPKFGKFYGPCGLAILFCLFVTGTITIDDIKNILGGITNGNLYF